MLLVRLAQQQREVHRTAFSLAGVCTDSSDVCQGQGRTAGRLQAL
jgi:hypothetical protein